MQGWWHKAYLFSEEALPTLGDRGSRVLYIDLDTVLVGSLDSMAAFDGSLGLLGNAIFCRPGHPSCGQRPLTRHRSPLGTDDMVNERRRGGFNSSVMAWPAGSHSPLWTTLSEVRNASDASACWSAQRSLTWASCVRI